MRHPQQIKTTQVTPPHHSDQITNHHQCVHCLSNLKLDKMAEILERMQHLEKMQTENSEKLYSESWRNDLNNLRSDLNRNESYLDRHYDRIINDMRSRQPIGNNHYQKHLPSHQSTKNINITHQNNEPELVLTANQEHRNNAREISNKSDNEEISDNYIETETSDDVGHSDKKTK